MNLTWTPNFNEEKLKLRLWTWILVLMHCKFFLGFHCSFKFSVVMYYNISCVFSSQLHIISHSSDFTQKKYWKVKHHSITQTYKILTYPGPNWLTTLTSSWSITQKKTFFTHYLIWLQITHVIPWINVLNIYTKKKKRKKITFAKIQKHTFLIYKRSVLAF